MNSKTTWRLFFAALAMFVFIWFFERNRPSSTGASGNVVIFSKVAAGSVTGVEIQTTNFTLRAERTAILSVARAVITSGRNDMDRPIPAVDRDTSHRASVVPFSLLMLRGVIVWVCP